MQVAHTCPALQASVSSHSLFYNYAPHTAAGGSISGRDSVKSMRRDEWVRFRAPVGGADELGSTTSGTSPGLLHMAFHFHDYYSRLCAWERKKAETEKTLAIYCIEERKEGYCFRDSNPSPSTNGDVNLIIDKVKLPDSRKLRSSKEQNGN